MVKVIKMIYIVGAAAMAALMVRDDPKDVQSNIMCSLTWPFVLWAAFIDWLDENPDDFDPDQLSSVAGEIENYLRSV